MAEEGQVWQTGHLIAGFESVNILVFDLGAGMLAFEYQNRIMRLLTLTVLATRRSLSRSIPPCKSLSINALEHKCKIRKDPATV